GGGADDGAVAGGPVDDVQLLALGAEDRVARARAVEHVRRHRPRRQRDRGHGADVVLVVGAEGHAEGRVASRVDRRGARAGRVRAGGKKKQDGEAGRGRHGGLLKAPIGGRRGGGAPPGGKRGGRGGGRGRAPPRGPRARAGHG